MHSQASCAIPVQVEQTHHTRRPRSMRATPSIDALPTHPMPPSICGDRPRRCVIRDSGTYVYCPHTASWWRTVLITHNNDDNDYPSPIAAFGVGYPPHMIQRHRRRCLSALRGASPCVHHHHAATPSAHPITTSLTRRVLCRRLWRLPTVTLCPLALWQWLALLDIFDHPHRPHRHCTLVPYPL